MKFQKGSPAARTLFGFLPLALSTLSTATGSAICEQHSHDGYAPEIEELYHGNIEYVANMSQTNPGLLQNLAIQGQQPPFMVIDCSDSRVNEQGIFSADPGTMFTAGNIANQYDEDDLNSNAVLSYAVETLKVKHVIVIGHYGCGGVAASMVPATSEHEAPTPRAASLAVETWIAPIRQLYQTSDRPEIVAHRTKYQNASQVDTPDLHDPGFRALVEENVKANVIRVANSSVIQEHYASLPTTNATDVYIHGWVYDIENGVVSDVGVSFGPPGKPVPPSPFPLIKSSNGTGNAC